MEYTTVFIKVKGNTITNIVVDESIAKVWELRGEEVHRLVYKPLSNPFMVLHSLMVACEEQLPDKKLVLASKFTGQW